MSIEVKTPEIIAPAERGQVPVVLGPEVAPNQDGNFLDRFRDTRVATAFAIVAVGVSGLIAANKAEANGQPAEASGAKIKKTTYDAYGLFGQTPKITQKANRDDPITVKYKFPFGYAVGVPSPVVAELSYNSRTKRKKAKPYYRDFGKRPVDLSDIYISEEYTTGNLMKDAEKIHDTNAPIEDITKFKNTKLYPGKKKKISTMLTIDQCNPWPTPANQNEAEYLESRTGFSTPPADYACTPVVLKFHYSASITGKKRGSKGPNSSRTKYTEIPPGDFQVNRIKVTPPSSP